MQHSAGLAISEEAFELSFEEGIRIFQAAMDKGELGKRNSMDHGWRPFVGMTSHLLCFEHRRE